MLDWLRAEWARPFHGWDFSYLAGRRETVDTKPWQFDPMLVEAIGRADAMVDLGTGDGRYLASRLAETARRPRLVCATEGHPPNVPLARDRLALLGAGVVEVDTDGQAPGQGRLPFVDGAFDLVMSRHTEYVAPEVARVLRPGGRLVTQQVGDQTNLDLHRVLGAPDPDRPAWDAGIAGAGAEAAGLHMLRAEDAFIVSRYHDVGAIAYYLKAVAWEIPDFTVDRYAGPLLALHRRLARDDGPIEVGFHLFLLVAERA